MPISKPRDLLCWDSRTQASATWMPSPNNSSWRPNLEFYPDTLQLLPGDILLFQPLKPGLTQKISQAFQRSDFTHAAIYCGFDHEICEATPMDGVALSSLEDSLEHYCVLARRVPGLTFEDCSRIAIEAGKLRGKPYAFSKVFQLAWNRFTTLYPKTDDAAQLGVICSTLCEHAIIAATKGRLCLRRNKDDVVTPARLGETGQLVDVQIAWTRVKRP